MKKRYAPNGTVFVNGEGTLTIQTAAYKGTAAITSGATYVWKKYMARAVFQEVRTGFE